jgi:hypothetical protein
MISKPHLQLLGVLKKQHSRLLGALKQLREEAFASLPARAFQILIGVLCWIFCDFLEPGFSVAFVVSLLLLACALMSFEYRRYTIATSAIAMLLVFVSIISMRASYFIASDQLRLRYRVVDGISYVEFPAKPSLLKTVSYLSSVQRLVIVDTCGGTKVAKLPLLPFAPLYADNDLIHSPFGYRRIPALRYEKLGLNVYTSAGPNLDPRMDGKTLVSVSFGFSDATEAIPATEVFPRSITCMVEHWVPLLPVLEFLPWNPEETDALVRAVVKVQDLRGVYPKRALSLDDLDKIRMSNKDETYRPLLDFVVYSILAQMVDGNILSEARADIINEQCVVVAGNPGVFAGPFSALPERRMRQIAYQIGPGNEEAYPGCHVPDDLIKEAERARSNEPGFPVFDTFRRCIDATIPMTDCLAGDDSPSERKPCNGDMCPATPRERPPWETLFQTYDLKFAEVVATTDNKLVEVRTVNPSKCPQLRDREEETQFIARWRWDSRRILGEPYKCTSPEWRRNLIESQRNFENALLCQKSKGIAVESLMTAEEVKSDFENSYLLRCDIKSYASNFSISESAYKDLDNLEASIAKLRTFTRAIGGRRIQQAVDGLDLLVRVKSAVCGNRSTKVCLEEYSNSGGYQQAFKRAREALNMSFVSENPAPVAIFNTASEMNNIIVNMALCDLLKDDHIQSLVGHNRDEFCDGRGLKRYRLIQSKGSTRTVHRPADELGEGLTYIYEENPNGRDFGLRLPITK